MKRQLFDIENKRNAIINTIDRNEKRKKIEVAMENIIHFPFIALTTPNSVDNKILIKSNQDKTYTGIFVTKDFTISGDTDLLVQMGAHYRH